MCGKDFHVSESYISRIIKERIGITFKNYLNNLKIEEAKKLLVASSCQINQVAETLGFQNANSFIRVFKKNEGITPGYYQKNYQESQLH